MFLANVSKEHINPNIFIPDSVSSVIEINLSAIRNNYNFVKRQVGLNCISAPVVKANAYGIGMIPVSKVLWEEGARDFFVATFEEGVALRKALPLAHIYLLNGLWLDMASDCQCFNLTPVLCDLGQVQIWQKEAKRIGRSALPAVIQVETGLLRLGISLEDIQKIVQDPSFFQGISLKYIMSHLACAYIPDHPYNILQRELFKKVQKFFPQIPGSFYGSGGLFRNNEDYYFDMVRPGRMLYGSTYTAGDNFSKFIEPVVSWRARILQVQEVKAGQSIGYDQTYIAQNSLKLATVGLGYADGYIRALSNRGFAQIAGIKVPIIGRVSMDLVTVDVTQVPERFIYPGAWMDFINNEITVDHVADAAGTVSWEILTRLSDRSYRLYIEESIEAS